MTPAVCSENWTLHHGDSLHVLPTLPDASVDAIVTDPPYSSGGQFRGDRAKDTADKYVHGQGGRMGRVSFDGDNRDQRGFLAWCALWLSDCYRIAKPGALCAVFCDWRQLPTMTDAVQAGGWVWRGLIPWNKTAATRPMKGWFRAQCEYLVVCAKGQPVMLDATGQSDAPALEGFFTSAEIEEGMPSIVCPVGRDNIHQTQKPTDLMRYILRITAPGGTVLDPFAGSGSTGVAALMEGRRFIGVEVVPDHHRDACRRLREAEQGGAQASLFTTAVEG